MDVQLPIVEIPQKRNILTLSEISKISDYSIFQDKIELTQSLFENDDMMQIYDNMKQFISKNPEEKDKNQVLLYCLHLLVLFLMIRPKLYKSFIYFMKMLFKDYENYQFNIINSFCSNPNLQNTSNLIFHLFGNNFLVDDKKAEYLFYGIQDNPLFTYIKDDDIENLKQYINNNFNPNLTLK